MNNLICFSEDVSTAFKDYMYHYLTESQKRKGFETYDKTISFSEKESKPRITPFPLLGGNPI